MHHVTPLSSPSHSIDPENQERQLSARIDRTDWNRTDSDLKIRKRRPADPGETSKKIAVKYVLISLGSPPCTQKKTLLCFASLSFCSDQPFHFVWVPARFYALLNNPGADSSHIPGYLYWLNRRIASVQRPRPRITERCHLWCRQQVHPLTHLAALPQDPQLTCPFLVIYFHRGLRRSIKKGSVNTPAKPHKVIVPQFGT